MDYNAIEEILGKSRPDDWLYDNEHGIYTYKPDVELNIKMRSDISPELIDLLARATNTNKEDLERTLKENEEYRAEWVRNFADPSAKKRMARVFYRGSFVKAWTFILVDGGRNYIPEAPHETKVITSLQYNIGKILNKSINGLREYDLKLTNAGIKLTDR